MIEKLIETLKLPELPDTNTREKCLEIMQREVYGYIPPKPESLEWEMISRFNERGYPYAGEKADPTWIRIFGKANGRDWSFKVRVIIPIKAEKPPLFIHVNFDSEIPGQHQPTEEIIDNGYAIINICYTDVTSDNADFMDGISKTFYPRGARKNPTDPGKIALWAWAAMRTLDFAEKAYGDRLDLENVAIAGHSRLGKTALLTAAYDERFKYVFANCSGCGGDAIEKVKIDTILHEQGNGIRGRAERIADIIKNFPYWFCENYFRYEGKPEIMDFDQHFLLACIAPRYLFTVAAEKDGWADPSGQFLSLCLASKQYEKLGVKGFVHNGDIPKVNDYYYEGNIGHSYREGKHWQNRTDWLHYMDFMKRKM